MSIPDNFRPLRGIVLIKRDTPEAVKDGIIIPEAWREYGWCGEVLAVGEDVDNVAIGDRVMFQKEYCVLPFKEREMGLSDAGKLLAKLKVIGNVEVIMPLNGFVVIEPDPVKRDEGPIRLIDRKRLKSSSGRVEALVFKKENDIRVGDRVWFEAHKAFVCVEDDKDKVLVDIAHIICKESGNDSNE